MAASQPRFASPDAYTPKHLAEKILTSKIAIEGERKHVTVLFADLKGSMDLLADRDPEKSTIICLSPFSSLKEGMMGTRDFLILLYGAFEGDISGRTTLQKMAFFVGEMIQEKHGYSPHYYGPYSSNIAEANSELKALGYIKERSSVYGIDHRGFEMARYDYSLTDDGWDLFNRKKKRNPEKWNDIQSAVGFIMKAGQLHYMNLAMAAKIYMVLDRHGGKADRETMKDLARKLGWSIEENDIDNAINFLSKLDLAKWVEATG